MRFVCFNFKIFRRLRLYWLCLKIHVFIVWGSTVNIFQGMLGTKGATMALNLFQVFRGIFIVQSFCKEYKFEDWNGYHDGSQNGSRTELKEIKNWLNTSIVPDTVSVIVVKSLHLNQVLSQINLSVTYNKIHWETLDYKISCIHR